MLTPSERDLPAICFFRCRYFWIAPDAGVDVAVHDQLAQLVYELATEVRT